MRTEHATASRVLSMPIPLLTPAVRAGRCCVRIRHAWRPLYGCFLFCFGRSSMLEKGLHLEPKYFLFDSSK